MKHDKTIAMSVKEYNKLRIKEVLMLTKDALNERGYDPVQQIAGYLISDDPAYISSYKNARNAIQSLDRYDIIEEIVGEYLRKCQE